MGNSSQGSHPIQYQLKAGGTVKYSYHDLEGRSHFPTQPSNEKVEAMFRECMQDIVPTEQQKHLAQSLSIKHKYRFAVRHHEQLKRLAEKQNNETESRKDKLIKTNQVNPLRMEQIQALLHRIEESKTSIKPLINELERLLDQNSYHRQFVEVFGLGRIMKLLQRQEKRNRQGMKNNFSNQIELLKLIKTLSINSTSSYQNSFSEAIASIPNYVSLVMRNFHPVNIAISALVLQLLTDYIWRTENSQRVVSQMQQYRSEFNFVWPLQIFMETLDTSNNILMVFYLLRFINQLLASFIDDDKMKTLKRDLKRNRYEIILENIKERIMHKWYKLQFCTFEYVQRRIFEYKDNAKNRIKEIENAKIRPTSELTKVNFELEQLVNFIINQEVTAQKDTKSVNETVTFDVYLTDNNRKLFTKFQLDVINQIDGYFVLEDTLKNNVDDTDNKRKPQKPETVLYYLQVVRKNCIDTQSEDILLECLKGMQHFNRDNWKTLRSDVQHILGVIETKEDIAKAQMELVRKQEVSLLAQSLEDKETLIKQLLHEKKELTMQLSQALEARKLKDNDKINPTTISITSTQIKELNTSVVQNIAKTSDLPLPPPPPPPPPPPITNSFSSNPSEAVSTGVTTLCSLPPLPSGPPPLIPLGTNDIGIPPLPSGPPPMIPLGTNDIGIPPLPSTIPNLVVVPDKTKPKCHPSLPLKACNISILTADNIKSTIWQQLDDSKVPIDKDQLQSLFARAEQQQNQQKLQSIITSPDEIKPEPVKLIDSDRSRNIEIILTKLRTPINVLCESLLTCHGKNYSATALENMRQILPSEEQLQAVANYTGNEQLALPEKYFKQLNKIPSFRSRINALIFKETYEEVIYELEQKVAQLIEGFTHMKGNRRLHYVLEVTLAVSNYLNGQGPTGGAWGFKLDSLERIEQTKSKDRKDNVAFFIVRQVWKKYPYPIFEPQELEKLKIIARTSVIQCQADLSELKKNQNDVEQAIKSHLKINKDSIQQVLKGILPVVKKSIKTISSQLQELEKIYQQCANFYAEDPKRQSSEEVGKKMLNCMYFICKTEETVTQLQTSKRKQEQRKAITTTIQYKPPFTQSKIIAQGKEQHPPANIGAIDQVPLELNPLSGLLALLIENPQVSGIAQQSQQSLQKVIKKNSRKESRLPKNPVEANRNNMLHFMEQVRRKRQSKFSIRNRNRDSKENPVDLVMDKQVNSLKKEQQPQEKVPHIEGKTSTQQNK